ncbi:calmodulin-like protein 4 isoform X1 [Esox lucius]|uniref:calmodulin-like protein 4 isoform X1 n=1 Tax=Esox lucius TaxID=8010 RepID=UPI00147738F5|nr:calmodulin-like protein 4 isoform X1 [Esox lucius]
MAKFLTQDQINEFKECFSLYDKKHKGKIEAKDLITAMRCLGVSPTFIEVDRHLQTYKIDKNGELDFSTFLTIMHRQIQQEDPRAEILEAMRMTDKQKKGYILASELRAKLTGLGEKLTDKEDIPAPGPSPAFPRFPELGLAFLHHRAGGQPMLQDGCQPGWALSG